VGAFARYGVEIEDAGDDVAFLNEVYFGEGRLFLLNLI
jgi:hypothetical protein